MTTNDVMVYGAYGHTGRFLVAELVRRGLTPVLSGRNKAALDDLALDHPRLEVRPAAVDDADALAEAARGTLAVVNAAGPFIDTAVPVAAAAVAAGAHYLDVTAEQPAVQQVYRVHAELGWRDDVAVVPAMAFYGGLSDLMATAAADDWVTLDEVTVAIGLDHWWPTEGTRVTGRRNTATRLVVEGGRLVPLADDAPATEWDFPHPVGTQGVTALPFAETITMARHLRSRRIQTLLASNALEEIRNPATPAPTAVDESGASTQRFVVEVVARRGAEERRITVAGRDIYAFTAPLVVEAVVRLRDGRATVAGAAAPGEVFDAADFLAALGPRHLTISRG